MKSNLINKTVSKRGGSPATPSSLNVGARIKELVKKLGGRKIAAESGEISVDQLDRYIRGQSQPSLTPVAMMATKAGVSLDWIWTGETQEQGESAEYEPIPLLNPEKTLSGDTSNAGAGAVAKLMFLKSWIIRDLKVNPEDLVAISVQGDSMEPTLSEGDVVLVNKTQQRIAGDGIYVIKISDGMIVKRLQHLPDGQFEARGDNPAYPPFLFNLSQIGDNLVIMGRVVWGGHCF